MQNRPQQPQIVIPQNIELPGTDLQTQDNGVNLYTLNNSDQEVVRVSFVFTAGSSLQEQPFSASTTANMLAEGTERYTAQQIAESLDFVGSYFDVNIDRDYTIVTFCALKKFLTQTLEIAEQILLHPTFPEHELTTYCVKRKERLSVERSKISFKSRELFAATLFGANHPYGTSSDEALYDDVKRDDIVRFHKKHFNAGNCFVVSSGDLDNEVIDSIAALSRQIEPARRLEQITFPEPAPDRYAFLEHKGAVQSAIRIGTILFTRDHPDYIALQVATTILGGYFGSRLVKNLREERGFTYGVFSAMVNLERAGYMAIATEVATEVTQQATQQIFAEIERMREEAVSEQELQMVKNIVIGEVMRVMDGPFGVADVTIENIQNRDDNSYINKFIDQVKQITPQRVQQVAQKYWNEDQFTTIIVGDSTADLSRS